MLSIKRRTAIFILFYFVYNLVLPPLVRAYEVTVTGNGSESSSDVTAEVSSTTTVVQENGGSVANNIDTTSNTGENSTSANTGSSTEISTGDTNTSVNIENQFNVSETEIGCCANDVSTSITDNGANSQNSVDLTVSNQSTTSINQSATINNNIIGYANTGNNEANSNTGDVSITTGDIKVIGQIINGPINVSSIETSVGGGNLTSLISGNGSNSNNFINALFDFQNSVYIYSNFNLENNVNWDLNTGGNRANSNTGDVSINTGDIFFNFLIKNIGNLSFVDVDCCDIFDPGKGVGEPEEEEDNNGGGGSSTSESKGSILPSAAATEAGGPGIAGLSDTTSENAKNIFFLAGMFMLSIGLKFLGESLPSKKFAISKKPR